MSGNTIKPGPRAVAALVLAGGSTLALPFLQRPTDSAASNSNPNSRTESAAKLSSSLGADTSAQNADAASRSSLTDSARQIRSHHSVAVTGELPSTRRPESLPATSHLEMPSWADRRSRIDELIAGGQARSIPVEDSIDSKSDLPRLPAWRPESPTPDGLLSRAENAASEPVGNPELANLLQPASSRAIAASSTGAAFLPSPGRPITQPATTALQQSASGVLPAPPNRAARHEIRTQQVVRPGVTAPDTRSTADFGSLPQEHRAARLPSRQPAFVYQPGLTTDQPERSLARPYQRRN